MKRPAFRYYITYGVTTQEVFPYETPKCKIQDKQEADQIFFRKKFSGKLVFRNDSKLGITDFDLFKTIELNGNSCTPIYIDIKEYCVAGDSYSSYWIGQFSTGSGSFDMNACRFEVTPDVVDKYSCLLSKWEHEFNIFDYAYSLQLAEKSTGVALQTLVGNTLQPGATVNCDGYTSDGTSLTLLSYYAPDYVSRADMFAKGWCVRSNTIVSVGSYVRLKIEILVGGPTQCNWVVGDVVTSITFPPPYATGTVCNVELISGAGVNCAGNTIYITLKNVSGTFTTLDNLNRNGENGGGGMARVLAIDSVAYYDRITVWESQLVQIPCVSGACIATPPGYFLVSSDCGTTGYCTFRRCPINVTGTKFRGVLMNDLVNEFAHSLCPDIDMMSSIFFEYNPDVSDSHYVSGINYITGTGNRLMDLLISQKSDIIDPNASNPATIGIVTLKKLLDWFREVFEVYWDIVDIGGNTVIRLEHFDFYASQQSTIDLSASSPYIEYILAKEKYEHLKLTIPQRETFEFVDSGGIDFLGKPIEYNSLCAQEDKEENHAPEDLSTDVDYILNSPNLKLEGFVMLATDYISGIYQLNYEPGLITGLSFTNAHLSWANLHYNYHRYNRYLSFGILNGNPTTFFSWKPNIKQAVLDLPLCCEAVVPTNYFVTVLSGIVSANGHVDLVEKNLHSGMVKLTLKYSI